MAENKKPEKIEDEKENVNEAEALNRELEDLAELFRRELEKAASEAETDEEAETVEVQGADNSLTEEADDGAVAYESMGRKRPFEFTSILAVVAVIAAVVMAVAAFSDYSEGYSIAARAKKLASENKLNSSIEVYDEAIEFFENKGVEPKALYLESAELVFRTMTDGSVSMDDIVNRIGTALDDAGFAAALYEDSLKTREETIVLFGTMQAFYSILQNEEYADITQADDAVYNAVMADVESLKELKITVKSIDGENTTEVYADECMVSFCQYMLAYTTGREDDAEKYLEKAYELNPEYLWLHAYEVGVNKIKDGDVDGGKKIAEKILENNIEEADGYCLYSYASRMSGDESGAIEWAREGLSLCPENAELLRYKAMAHIAAGDLESAKKSIDEAMLYDEYALLYYTAIVVENELGNTATVNELVSTVESGGLELSEELTAYLEGSVTAQELFTKGSGDVE